MDFGEKQLNDLNRLFILEYEITERIKEYHKLGGQLYQHVLKTKSAWEVARFYSDSTYGNRDILGYFWYKDDADKFVEEFKDKGAPKLKVGRINLVKINGNWMRYYRNIRLKGKEPKDDSEKTEAATNA